MGPVVLVVQPAPVTKLIVEDLLQGTAAGGTPADTTPDPGLGSDPRPAYQS